MLMLPTGRRAAGGTTTGSTGYSSPAPSTVYSGNGTQRSARLAASDFSQSARQSPLPRRQTPSVEAEEDAEGEEDDGNEEDKNLYCFCQKLSYGTVGIECRRYRCTLFTIGRPQMVGCDDEECRYQWVMPMHAHVTIQPH
jgi:chromatin modification-related protein YNG2